MLRQFTLGFVAAIAGAIGLSATSAAEERFPSKPITIVIPYAPGGGGDVYSRGIQPFLEKALGTTIVIENIAGAGGIVGQSAAFNRPADGYTLVLWSTPSNELNAITNDTPFKIADWEGLGAAAPGQTIVAVPANRPWNSFSELVAAMKKEPRKISVGGIGPFGTGGISYALLAEKLGIEGRWVPFAGTAEVSTALLGGHVDAVLVGGSEKSFVSQMTEKKIKILGVLSKEAAGPYAEAKLPTIESQVGQPIYHEVQRGHVVRAGTPPDRLAKLREAYRAAATDPAFKRHVEEKMGPYAFIDGAGMTDVLRSSTAELQAILPALNKMAGK
jgi:tripartite-type tricarboxylate transporter receptor subunit TctC